MDTYYTDLLVLKVKIYYFRGETIFDILILIGCAAEDFWEFFQLQFDVFYLILIIYLKWRLANRYSKEDCISV